MRLLLCWLAHLARGLVRCMFPLACLAVLAGLITSDQGRDVLVALVEFAADERHGKSIAGLVFLAAGATLLSVSLWYSMRWLLAAEMAALPLPDPPGWGQRWAPRLAGGLAPALIAVGLAAHDTGHRGVAIGWAVGFALLALLLVAAFGWRGDAMLALHRRGWMDSLEGRDGVQPARLRADAPLPALTLRVIVWSIVLTLIVAVLIVLFPVTLPRVIGAAAVAAIALASINLFGSFVLTYAPLRHGLPPLALMAFLLAAALGALNDNHRVATVEAGPAPAPVARRTLAADFARFVEAAAKGPDGRPTVVFVASEGGGIRAAYWTAAVLERLSERVPDLLGRNLYALSGVSGGSLGVAAWLMAQRERYCPQVAAQPGAARAAARQGPTASLGLDFVSPAVAGIFYYDLAQRFLPFAVPAFDRSRAMEQGWQRAFAHLPGRPFEQTLDALYHDCPALPRLLLNATVVETGQRAVLGPLALAADDGARCNLDPLFLNSMPAMADDLATRRQSLAGLVHHSARFPVVSPAGTVWRPARASCPEAFRLVDGGYFDNSGALTVLDLVRQLRATAIDFRALVLLLRNDASPLCAQAVEGDLAPSRIAPELTSVVSALANARGSHAVSARAALLREPVEVIDLVVPAGSAAANAPLGWALSDVVRQALDQAAAGEAARAARLLAGGGGAIDTCDRRQP